MIQLTKDTLVIIISTENPAAYLYELQIALNDIIASVAESPELNQYKDIPEALFKLRQMQTEVMPSVEQLKKIQEKR